MKRFLSFLICACLLVVPSELRAQNKSERERLADEIARLDRQISANSSKSADATAKLKLTQKKVNSQKKLVQVADAEVASFNKKIKAKQREIAEAQRQLDTTLLYYEKLVRTAYVNRDPRIWFMYILTGDNLSQGLHRYSYLKQMSSQMHSYAERIIAEKESLEQQKKDLEKMRSESLKVLEDRNREYKKLKSAESSEKALLSKLKKDTARLKKEIAAKQRRADELDKKVKGLVGKKVMSAADKKLSGAFSSNKGKLPWPVDGVVVERFGEHAHPVMKKVKVKSKGVNIAVEAGAPVYAIFEGTVCNVVIMPGYNQCVLVQHGEYYSFYCGLKDVGVKAGQKIPSGKELGHVDTINGETQLHFQIWKSSTVQNPESWLVK